MTLLLWLLALLLFGLGSGSSSSTSAAPAVTVPAPAGAAGTCSTGQLRPRVELQGAAGSLRGAVELRNVGEACVLDVVGLGIDGDSSGIDVALPPRPPLELASGAGASLSVVWRNWCGGPNPRLAVELGARGRVVVPLADTPRCDDAGAPSLLDVGAPTPAP